MEINGCLYVFTIRKINIIWSAPFKTPGGLLVLSVKRLVDIFSHCFVFIPRHLSCDEGSVIDSSPTLFFNQRPQGKSYLFFTQFKAEIKGATIEYASAYVSIANPVNNTQDAAFSPKCHEESM